MARPRQRGNRTQSNIHEVDLHGMSEVESIRFLDHLLSEQAWRNLTRVRIVHGTGAVLYRAVREWAEKRGFVYTLEEHNTGVTILHVRQRTPVAESGPTVITKPLREALTGFTPARVDPPQPTKRAKAALVTQEATPEPDPASLFEEALKTINDADIRQLARMKTGR